MRGCPPVDIMSAVNDIFRTVRYSWNRSTSINLQSAKDSNRGHIFEEPDITIPLNTLIDIVEAECGGVLPKTRVNNRRQEEFEFSPSNGLFFPYTKLERIEQEHDTWLERPDTVFLHDFKNFDSFQKIFFVGRLTVAYHQLAFLLPR